MEEQLHNILGKFSLEDIEKLRMLFPILHTAEQKEVVTLRVFSEEYKNLIKSNSSISYSKSVRISLDNLTEFFGIQRPITSIELREIEKFLTYLQQKVKKGYVVYYRNLKAAFNKAKDWGYIKENYFLKVKLPKRQKTAPSYIDYPQLSAIIKHIENQTVGEIVIIAFFSGMRLSEITNLTWRNVNLVTRIIAVGDENFATKSRNQRHIPMSEEVFELIMKNAEVKRKVFKLKEDYIFCKSDGKKFTGDYISKCFKRACKAEGIDKSIHFHSLRHSFASNLAQKGISLYVIKELLGHASVSTTEIYAHLNMDSLKEAIKKLEPVKM